MKSTDSTAADDFQLEDADNAKLQEDLALEGEPIVGADEDAVANGTFHEQIGDPLSTTDGWEASDPAVDDMTDMSKADKAPTADEDDLAAL